MTILLAGVREVIAKRRGDGEAMISCNFKIMYLILVHYFVVKSNVWGKAWKGRHGMLRRAKSGEIKRGA